MDSDEPVSDTTPKPAPDYTVRAAFHERAAQAVRKKIQKLYNLNDEDLSLPADAVLKMPSAARLIGIISSGSQQPWVHSTKQKLADIPNQKDWKRARQEAVKNSDLTQAVYANINQKAQAIMLRYVEAFYLRYLVNKSGEAVNEDSYVGRVKPGLELTQILINHLSNQAEAELCHAGLTANNAHRLHAMLIRKTVDAFSISTARDLELASAGKVDPMLGTSKNNPRKQTTERIDSLQNYWKDRAEALEKKHRSFNADTDVSR